MGSRIWVTGTGNHKQIYNKTGTFWTGILINGKIIQYNTKKCNAVQGNTIQ